MSTTKPIAESGWSKRMSHEHVMSTADQELAHTLKNEFLDLCLNHKASTLVALSAARCAAECFESIINEQGGEVFTVNAPSDFEQLIQLRNAVIDAERFLAWWCEATVPNPPKGVRGAKATLAALREALTPKGEQS